MKRLLFLLLLAAPAWALDVAVNNASLVAGLSPANWETSGSTYIRAVNGGAYFKINFTGTSFGIKVDMASVNALSIVARRYPIVATSVDGGAFTTYQLLSTDTTVTLATGLADTTHSITVLLSGADAWSARWNGSWCLKITALVIDAGKAVSAATLQPKRIVVFGDSIVESAWCIAYNADSSYYVVDSDATKSWARIFAGLMNAEYGSVAFGGQGWTTTWNSDVPALPSSYNYVLSGVSRSFASLDEAYVIMGNNPSVPTSSAVTTFLGTLRTAVGATTRLYLCVPFNRGNPNAPGMADLLTTAYAAYVAANPTDNIRLIDLGSFGQTTTSTNSTDGLHLSTAGQAAVGPYFYRIVRPPAQTIGYFAG